MKFEFKTGIIENYLKENNMSKAAFCKLCGISPSTLTRIMNHKNCRITAIVKIARVLKMPLVELFGAE